MARSISLFVKSLACAFLLLVASCKYTYENPAEDLRPGEVQGYAVAERDDQPGAFDPLAEVVVGLLNSGFTELSRPSGRFTLLDLPQGNHTILFRQGLDRVAMRQVEIGLGSDGQPEGVWTEDLILPYAANVQGTVQGSAGETLVRCLALDATSGLWGGSSAAVALDPKLSCTYEFTALAVGDHELRFIAWTATSDILVGGPLRFSVADVDQQTTKALEPTLLHVPSGAGQIASRVRIVGSEPRVDLGQITVQVIDPSIDPAIVIHSATPDSTGLVSFPPVSEGGYYLQVTHGASAELVMPPPLGVIVLSDQLTDLGNVYVVTMASATGAQRDCDSDADCESGYPCMGGSCSGWTMPEVALPTLQVCNPRDYCDTTCASPNYECMPISPSTPDGYCITCGDSCTPDGLDVLTANDGCTP